VFYVPWSFIVPAHGTFFPSSPPVFLLLYERTTLQPRGFLESLSVPWLLLRVLLSSSFPQTRSPSRRRGLREFLKGALRVVPCLLLLPRPFRHSPAWAVRPISCSPGTGLVKTSLTNDPTTFRQHPSDPRLFAVRSNPSRSLGKRSLPRCDAGLLFWFFFSWLVIPNSENFRRGLEVLMKVPCCLAQKGPFGFSFHYSSPPCIFL